MPFISFTVSDVLCNSFIGDLQTQPFLKANMYPENLKKLALNIKIYRQVIDDFS